MEIEEFKKAEDLDALFESGEQAVIDSIENLLLTEAVNEATGMNILHYAISKGYKYAVDALLNDGAIGLLINQGNVNGSTPLHFACANGYQDIALALIDKGANLDIQNKDRGTPLMFACMNGHTDIAISLLERGADPDLANYNGDTALHIACEKGHQGIALALLDKGANPNLPDNDGYKALHYACQDNNKELVEALLIRGADPTARNNKGKEPLDLTENEIIRELISAAKEVIEERKREEENRLMREEDKPTPTKGVEEKQREKHTSSVVDPDSIDSSDQLRAFVPTSKSIVKDELDKKLEEWNKYTAGKKREENYENVRNEITKELAKRNKEKYQEIPALTNEALSKEKKEIDYLGFPEDQKPIRATRFEVNGVEINIAFDQGEKMYLSRDSLEAIQKNEITCCLTIEGKKGNKDEFLEFRAGKLFVIDHGPGHENTSLVGGKEALIYGYRQNKEIIRLQEKQRGSVRQQTSPRRGLLLGERSESMQQGLDSRSKVPADALVQGENERQAAHHADPLRERSVSLGESNESMQQGLDSRSAGTLARKTTPISKEKAFTRTDFSSIVRPEELDAYGAYLDGKIKELREKIAAIEEDKSKIAKELQDKDLEKAKLEGLLQGKGIKLKKGKDDIVVLSTGKTGIRDFIYPKTIAEARLKIDSYNKEVERLKSERLQPELNKAKKTLQNLEERKAEQAFDRQVVTYLENNYGRRTVYDYQTNDLVAVYLEKRDEFREKFKEQNPQLILKTLTFSAIDERYLDQVVAIMRNVRVERNRKLEGEKKRKLLGELGSVLGDVSNEENIKPSLIPINIRGKGLSLKARGSDNARGG